MGITLAYGGTDFFREVLANDVSGKTVLTLGKLRVQMTPYQCFVFAYRMGIKPCVSGREADKGDIACLPEEIGQNEFFRLLGFKAAYSLDVSDYEGADYILNLGEDPCPEELKNHFDYIVDGGTLEHVYNVPHALENILSMLKVGGKVFHYVPANNNINHGFYQFSPELLDAFYTENGCKTLVSDLLLESRDLAERYDNIKCANINGNWLPEKLDEDLTTTIDYRILNMRDGRWGGYLAHIPDYAVMLHFVARKVKDVKRITAPVQRHWYCDYDVDSFIDYCDLGRKLYGSTAIWGIGNTAKTLMNFFEGSKLFKRKYIKGFFDSDKIEGDFCGYPILDHRKISTIGIDSIIIAANDYETEIYNQLIGLTKGSDDIRVIKSSLFFYL